LSPNRARPAPDRRPVCPATGTPAQQAMLRGCVLGLVLVLTLIGPGPTRANQPPAAPSVEAQQAQAQSQAIRRSLKALEQDLRKAQGQLSGTELALRDLEQSVARKAEAEQQLATQVDQAQGVLEELTVRHAGQRQRLEALEQGLSASVRLLHALSLTGLAADDRRTGLPYADWTGQLNRALAAELQAQQQLSAEYAYTRDSLTREQAQLRTLLTELQGQRRALEQARREAGARRQALQQAVATDERKRTRLQREQKDIEVALKAFALRAERERQPEPPAQAATRPAESAPPTPAAKPKVAQVEAAAPPAPKTSTPSGGGLPVTGTVVTRFGEEQRGGKSRGVRLAAPAKAPVRAVAEGVVAYADWLKGYGMLVILEHPGGLMSLYGNNERLAVRVGERVRRGGVIAHLGAGGAKSGPQLYFEVLKRGEPINPTRYLALAPEG